jgi:hypothetical protein
LIIRQICLDKLILTGYSGNKAMTNPQVFRKKELKTCPTPGCGFQRIAYANAMDLCPRCQRNARQKKHRDNKKNTPQKPYPRKINDS